MRQKLRDLWQERRGVVALEFALVLPMLVLLLTGGVEFGRMLLLSQKLQNGAFILADLAAREEHLSDAKLTAIFPAISSLMEPFEFDTNAVAIVSGVQGIGDGDAEVNWQRSGGGTLAHASAVGVPGGEAAIPEALVLADKETVVVAEIFYEFQPLFELVLDPMTVHKVAYLKPRLGVLDALEP